jgi:hypothetical protein
MAHAASYYYFVDYFINDRKASFNAKVANTTTRTHDL